MDTQVLEGEETQEDPRRCEKLKEDGSRCKGWKVTGSAYCAGHSGLGLAASPEAAKKAAQASAEGRQQLAEERAEARKRSLADVLAARLEARADELVNRMLDIAENGGDADALRAIASMLDRVYGRPTERVEVTEVDMPETVAELRRLSPEQRRAALRQANQERAAS